MSFLKVLLFDTFNQTLSIHLAKSTLADEGGNIINLPSLREWDSLLLHHHNNNQSSLSSHLENDMSQHQHNDNFSTTGASNDDGTGERKEIKDIKAEVVSTTKTATTSSDSVPAAQSSSNPKTTKTNTGNDDENHQSRPLLTFWTRTTLSNPQAMIVTRTVDGFHEVLPAVEFRQCIDEHSYQAAADNNSSVGALEPCPVLQNHPTPHPIYDNETTFAITVDQSKLVLSKGHLRPTSQSFLAISYWDKATRQHVPFQREAVPKKGFTFKYLEIRHCDSNEHGNNNCPDSCDWKQQQTPSPYPYFWDGEDHLCKSQNPTLLQRYRGYRNHQASCNCESVCYTQEAVDDIPQAQVWPWKSAEERALYHTDDPTQKAFIINEGIKGTKMRKFDEEQSVHKPRFDCPSSASSNTTTKTIPLPIVGTFTHHLLFNPEAKLIFCGIPKAGITEWIKFFRFVSGAKDYLALPHFKSDRREFFVSSLSVEKATEILLDPSWTKAVIFRDPAERLLSAYLDKVVANGFTQTHFKIGITDEFLEDPRTAKNRTRLSFEEFVDLVTMPPNFVDGKLKADPPGHGIHGFTDPHWRPQSMMCGMDYLLPHFNFIGNLNFISDHTKLLLEKVGLWEKYGSKFDAAKDGYSKGRLCTQAILSDGDPGYNASRSVDGFNQNGVSGKQRMTHTRNSKYKLDDYYTPELMAKVRQAYAMDFQIFEELQHRAETNGVSDVPSGQSLDIVKSQCNAGNTS